MIDNEKEDDGSLRDTLVAAFKENTDGDTATSSAEQNGATDAPKQAEQSAVQSREGGEKPNTPATTEAPKADKPIDPPARWTKEEKEQFAALDPSIQKILLGRNKGLEADYTRKMGEIAQERQRFHQLEQVLGPRRDTWQRQGMNDAQFINSVMSYWDLAQRDPMSFIDTFARERGIDLAAAYTPTAEQIAAYFGGQTQAGGDPNGYAQANNLPPAVMQQLNAMQQQQEQLRNVVMQQHQTLTQREQAERQAMNNAATSEIQQFMNAADENGSPLYPFFQDVRTDMVKLMQSGFAQTLHEAYEKAVHIRPDVRSKLEENREITRRRAEEQRRQEEAAKARRAGASVSSSSSTFTPSSTTPDDDGASIRSIIASQFAAARVGGRV
jgi:hypothetical protein